jgi:hypothetical protein
MRYGIWVFALLLPLSLAVVLMAAQNQSVIFKGYSHVNSVATDADTAWLYLSYYADSVTIVEVTAENRVYAGMYEYDLLTDNDSIAGWHGDYVFVFNSISKTMSTTAEVIRGRDSSYALETSITAIRDSMDEAATDYSITLSGTADSGSTTMIALNGGVATTGWYGGQLVVITGGTGAGQSRTILEYTVTGAEKIATVTRDWVTAPDNTSTFVVYAFDVPAILEAGTASSGTGSTIVLDDNASDITATYKDNFVTITGGTGRGQTRLIEAYNGGTHTVQVIPVWNTAPDVTSIYQIYPGGRVDIGQISGDATAADNMELDYDGTGYDNIAADEIDDGDIADNAIDAGAIADDAIDAGAFADSSIHIAAVMGEIYEHAGDIINDSVWDADSSEFMDDNDGTMAYAIQSMLDSLDTQSWAGVGAGSDSLSHIKWTNWAVWGLVEDTDSSANTQRYTAGGSGCTGSGTYSCTLYVKDTTNNAYVAGAAITVNNQTEDGTELVADATSDGYRVFSLNDGDYRASALHPPYIFETTDFTISGAALKDSCMGYAPVIGTPSAASICSVYAWVEDPAGQKIAGARVSATLVSAVDTTIDGNMLVIDHKPIVGYSDTDGYWSLGLIKNSTIDTLSAYRIEIERSVGVVQSSDVYVPDSSTVNFRDLLRSFSRSR